MTWDRAGLAKQGFYYDENIRSKTAAEAAYPPHVVALRASMLDFSCPVLGCKHECDESGNLQLDPESIEWHSPHLDTGLSVAKRTQNDAHHLNRGGFAEIVWNEFFHNHFFKPLQDSTSMCKANSRRVSRSNYYYDSFKEDADALWTEFLRSRTHAHDTSEKEKCPKPDRVLSLPIYNLDTDSPAIPSIRDPESRQWHQTPSPSLVESFSWTVLKDLFAYGLRPTPFRIFHNPPVEAQLRCYPWLIIEHKKQPPKSPEGKTLDVRCQATNAAARALQPNRNAATYAVKLAEQAQVPPIPTVTTVGPIVTVWIMHYLEDLCGPSSHYDLHEEDRKTRRDGYIMRAIWKGDMTKLDDIIQFQLILENTHTWTMRVFKPLMASYIGQWRFVHSQPGIAMTELALEHRQQIMDRCRVMTPLVQGYLVAHSGIEIGDDSSRSEVTPLLIGLLVQQIFASERQTLTNEMDRIITEKLQGLTLGARHIVSDTQLTIRSKHTSLVADTQESCSVDSAPDDDDPDDSDYVDSQPTGHAISYSDSDDNEFRRSTRSNALREPEAQSPSSSPQLLPIEETPRPIRTKSSPGALTPLSTGTTSPADLSTCTPTRNKSTTPKSVGPVTKNVTGTTKRVHSLEEDAMSAKPTTKAMSGKFLFQATKKWPLATLIPTASGSIQQGDLPSPTPAAKAAPESSLYSTTSSMSSMKGQPLSKLLEAPSLSFGTTRGDETITGGKAFRLWHKNAKISTQVLLGHNRGMHSLVAVSPDSKLVASLPIYGTVRLWRSDTGECMPTSDSGGGHIKTLAFSHDSKLVLVVRNSDAVQLWRPETDKFTHIQTLGLDEFIMSAVFSPDLRFLALVHSDKSIRLWLVDSDKLTLSQVLEGHISLTRPVTFSHNSKFMASISDDYTVRIWLADSGKFTLTQILEGHNNTVLSVAFSHDSNFIASGSHDCMVWLWCAAGTDKFEHTRTFHGHTHSVLSVAFSHDLTLLASASMVGTIRLWQTDNGECTQVLDGHTDDVRSVAFAKNSEFLASASDDMTVRLWRPHMSENDSDSVNST